MLDPTVDPDVSIDVRNRVAKSKNQKSMRYLRDTISTLRVGLSDLEEKKSKVKHRTSHV
jgi:hypothetical protein